jgi:hypothetical protein
VSGDAKIRDWREICEDVLREKSQERLEELLQELLDALDKKEQLEKPSNSCRA